VLVEGCAESKNGFEGQRRRDNGGGFRSQNVSRAKPRPILVVEPGEFSVGPSAFGHGERDFAGEDCNASARRVSSSDSARTTRVADSAETTLQAPSVLTGAAISGGAARRDCSAADARCAASVRALHSGRSQMSIARRQ